MRSEIDLEELIHLVHQNPNDVTVRPSKVRSMFAMRACRSSIMIGKTLSFKTMAEVVGHMVCNNIVFFPVTSIKKNEKILLRAGENGKNIGSAIINKRFLPCNLFLFMTIENV